MSDNLLVHNIYIYKKIIKYEEGINIYKKITKELYRLKANIKNQKTVDANTMKMSLDWCINEMEIS